MIEESECGARNGGARGLIMETAHGRSNGRLIGLGMFGGGNCACDEGLLVGRVGCNGQYWHHHQSHGGSARWKKDRRTINELYHRRGRWNPIYEGSK